MVFVNGIAVVSGLRGSFATIDGAFDLDRHKLAVTSYTFEDGSVAWPKRIGTMLFVY